MTSRSLFDTAREVARAAAAREAALAAVPVCLSPPRVSKRAKAGAGDGGDGDAAGARPAVDDAPAPRPLPLPPSSFYTPLSTPSSLTPVERGLVRLLTAVDARLRAEGRTGGGTALAPTWLSFGRQAPAFAAADAADPAAGLRVFSVEKPAPGGGRLYIVTTLPELWRRYRDAPPVGRRHYEILREGRPVHLYLDIEFKRRGVEEDATSTTPPSPPPLNANVDGDALVDAIIASVAARLASDHGVAVSAADILELDASSASKFSRHVTIRVGGVAFASTADVGALVRAALSAPPPAWRLEGEGAQAPPPPEALGSAPTTTTSTAATPTAALHVDDAYMVARDDAREDCPSTRPVPAVDLGVYTRNRAWRMAGSAKAGDPERRVLIPTGRYGGAGASFRAIFFAGLAGDVGPGVRLIDREDAVCGGGGGGGGGSGGGSARPPRQTGRPTISTSSPFSIQPGPSPVPVLDAFIEGVAARASRDAGGPVSVRAWALWGGGGGCGDPTTTAQPPSGFLLALRGGRYCGRIGRPHASNGVYYIVDAASASFMQRCYDPECRGYRSEAAALPADVARAAAGALPGLVSGGSCVTTADDEEEEDEAALIEAVSRIEAAALAARRAQAEFEAEDAEWDADAVEAAVGGVGK